MNVFRTNRTQLLSLFEQDMIELVSILDVSLKEKDVQKTLQALHKMKGGSGYVGAEVIARLCDTLAESYSEGSPDTAIRRHFDTLQKEIQTFLDRERLLL